MAPNTKGVDPKNQCAGMALLHEEDDHNHKDKKNNNAQRTDTYQNLKRHVPLGSL